MLGESIIDADFFGMVSDIVHCIIVLEGLLAHDSLFAQLWSHACVPDLVAFDTFVSLCFELPLCEAASNEPGHCDVWSLRRSAASVDRRKLPFSLSLHCLALVF